MTTVEIMFRKNFFLNDHGEVISYAILVAEDYTKVRILKKQICCIGDLKLFVSCHFYKHKIKFYYSQQLESLHCQNGRQCNNFGLGHLTRHRIYSSHSITRPAPTSRLVLKNVNSSKVIAMDLWNLVQDTGEKMWH